MGASTMHREQHPRCIFDDRNSLRRFERFERFGAPTLEKGFVAVYSERMRPNERDLPRSGIQVGKRSLEFQEWLGAFFGFRTKTCMHAGVR
jgi:hypothetical protein